MAALSVSAESAAQGLVAKAGVSLGTLKLGPDNPAVDPLLGFVGGGAVEPRIKFLPGLQIEGLYAVRGAKSPQGLKIELSYLTVPILERVKVSGSLPLRIHAFIGPEIAFLLRARLRNGAEAIDYTMFMKDRDVAVVAGFDVEIKHVLAELRYTRGSNIAADPGQAGDNWKSRAISVMGGWRFK